MYNVEKGSTFQTGLYAKVDIPAKLALYLTELARYVSVDLDPDDLHMTIMYSPEPMEPSALDDVHLISVSGSVVGVELFTGHKGTQVLAFKVDSPSARINHELLKDIGCKSTFSGYKAHITITTDYTGNRYDVVKALSDALSDNPLEFKHLPVEVKDLD